MRVTPHFTSSDERLVAGWAWAVEQALAYVRSGDPVGDWFEAALPGRNAFCMRDVAHQTSGAQVLGLRAEVKNMLRRFAENIAESRDWCSYWEITGDNLPAPVDYSNDTDFWYNLPANFDVLECCWRQYLWTGDPDYVNDPIFLNFYDRTVTDYVRQWDTDGDGLLEHLPQYGRRGIGSYEEGVSRIRIGADLIAAQVAAYEAYAHIQSSCRCKTDLDQTFAEKAESIRQYFEQAWWNASANNYYSFLSDDRTFSRFANFGTEAFVLYFELTHDAARVANVLDVLNALFQQTNVESQSYFPEVAYKYGDHQAAYDALLHLTDPALPRREYPEVSYSVLGAIVNGMLGIHADATTQTISTVSRLTDATAAASIEHLAILDNDIAVEHRSGTQTSLTNERGASVSWLARFAGSYPALRVDGVEQSASQTINRNGQPETSTTVTVPPGTQITIAVPV